MVELKTALTIVFIAVSVIATILAVVALIVASTKSSSESGNGDGGNGDGGGGGNGGNGNGGDASSDQGLTEYDWPVIMGGAFATEQSVTIKLYKIGKTVTAYIPATFATSQSSGANAFITINSADGGPPSIPANFLPKITPGSSNPSILYGIGIIIATEWRPGLLSLQSNQWRIGRVHVAGGGEFSPFESDGSNIGMLNTHVTWHTN